MNIIHVESGETIATDAKRASNYWQRFRGLMLAGKLAPGEALVIEPCSSIHMMFMRFSIDAVFYDREGRITKVARNVRPWIGMSMGGKGARGVIEMRKGDAAALAAGDHVVMSDATTA